MFEDQEVQLDDRRYRWSCDSDDGSASNCWKWELAGQYVKAPQAQYGPLNRKFIDERAGDAVADLDDTGRMRFLQILQEMGASDEDLCNVGLEQELIASHPEKGLTRHLPPAAHIPFNSKVLRDWFFGLGSTTSLPTSALCLGSGPFDTDELSAFLRSQAILPCAEGESPAVVVLGRDGWEEDEIDDLIDSRVDRGLRIYSQEMFLAFLSSKRDPFHSWGLVLDAFKAGHPGLEFVAQGWAGWVESFVTHDRRTRNPNRSFQGDAVSESPLHAIGYRVGREGNSEADRRRLLRQAFEGELPFVNSAAYMAPWGEPRSAARLKKIADNLATNCRNGKRNPIGSNEAIEHWEADLEWLHDNFYNGHLRFAWPAVWV